MAATKLTMTHCCYTNQYYHLQQITFQNTPDPLHLDVAPLLQKMKARIPMLLSFSLCNMLVLKAMQHSP